MPLLGVVCLVAPGFAEQPTSPRARPPRFSAAEEAVFFEDARQQLVGSRPQVGEKDSVAGTAGEAVVDTEWAALIDGDTLTAEVKRTVNRLNTSLRRVGPFRSGGNVQCRQEFAMLATLFQVISAHESELRWKASAPTMHELCFATAESCSEPTKESYEAAKAAYEVLAELLRGTTPAEQAPGSPPQLVDQTILMQRMETALETTISPALSDKRTFRRKSEDLRHESRMLAMLAKVIQHPDYDYGEDEDFLRMAEDLRKASQTISESVDSGDYDATREATGRASQSCSACHEGYRG